MYHFSNDEDSIEYAKSVCKEAVERGIVQTAKHTRFGFIFGPPTGVACFYIHGADDAAHRRVIAYFLEKGLIRKTKTGKRNFSASNTLLAEICIVRRKLWHK